LKRLEAANADDYTLLAGLALPVSLAEGKLTLGAFVEHEFDGKAKASITATASPRPTSRATPVSPKSASPSRPAPANP
jgi:hypothetical protein